MIFFENEFYTNISEEKMTTCHSTCHLCDNYCKIGDTPHEKHFCENSHSCKKYCDSKIFKGYCSVQNIDEISTSQKQQGYRKKCCKILKPFKGEHEGNHCHVLDNLDLVKPYHSCNVECPSCGYLCNLEYGHSGLHNLKEHGAMINSIFLSNSNNVKIQLENNRILNTIRGQSGIVFKCHEYCQRSGNGHYHYCLCKQNEKCKYKESFNSVGIEHLTDKISNLYKHIDMVSHETYWNLVGFVDPAKRNYTCGEMNLNGNYCTRTIGHEKLNVHNKKYHWNLLNLSEQFHRGGLTYEGHHFNETDKPWHSVLLIDCSAIQKLTDLAPSFLDSCVELKKLKNRFGYSIEFLLRYTQLRYKVNPSIYTKQFNENS